MESYFERSLAAIESRFPDVHALVAKTPEEVAPVWEDGRLVDLRVGETRLYDGDGMRIAERQVEAYLKQPLRFGIADPRGAGLGSPVGMRMLERMKRELGERGMDRLDRFPVTGDYFLMAFGVGLGHHLPRLVTESKAKWVLLVEPLPGLLHWSLHALDWQALFEEADRKGIEIRIQCGEDDPQRIVNWLTDRVEERGIGFVDGSYAFIHYPLWALKNARERLMESIDRRFLARGFFEDELVMSTNAVANMLGTGGQYVDGRPRLERAEPVLIVGSGPSVDGAIDTIRRWQDRAVVISCGTALRVLLSQGIVPDFHVEIENGKWVPEVLSSAAAVGDLKRIALVTTFTVDPAVPPLFRETFFFFRDSVSSTVLLCRGGRRDIFGAAPTVANTALSLASMLGFTEFYLFGVDCGVREGGDNHSRDSVYHAEASWKAKAKTYKYPIDVPANFGGVAYTDWLLDWSRGMLAQVALMRHLRVFNCSDGVLIERTVPMLPEAIRLAGRACQRAPMLNELRRRTQAFAPGELLGDFDFAAVAAEMRSLECDVHAVVDRVASEGGDFAELYVAIHFFLEEAKRGYRGGWSIPIGSISSLTRVGMFYGLRLADEDLRRELFQVFVEEYKRLTTEMCERTAAMLEGFALEAAGPLEVAAARA